MPQRPQNVLIEKHTKPQEALSGADWEMWFGRPGSYIGFRVQAKLLHPDTARYEHLLKSKTAPRQQADDLVVSAFSGKFPTYPLYSFYNHYLPTGTGPAVSPCPTAGTEPLMHGWTVASALAVRDVLRRAPSKRVADFEHLAYRSFRFYLGARLCFLNRLYSPAAFCAQQALESLLKATLVYWDASFSPERAAHKFEKMLRTLRNKVPGAKGAEIPKYFYFEGRYQATSRYPTRERGVGIPSSFLEDLDAAFDDFLRLVPFQFNSELIRLLAAPDSRERRVLTYRNHRSRQLQRFLRVKRKRVPSNPGLDLTR